MNKILEPFYNMIMKINEVIFSLGNVTGILAGFIILLIGILLAFWGYRLKKIALLVIGFIIGFTIGLMVADINNIDLKFKIIIALISGISSALIIYFLYFLAVFIIGIFIGGSLGFMISTILETNNLITIIIVAVFALIGGLLSKKINKILFIILTAYYGYILVRIGINSINIFKLNIMIEEIIAIIILISGIIFQFYENSEINDNESL